MIQSYSNTTQPTLPRHLPRPKQTHLKNPLRNKGALKTSEKVPVLVKQHPQAGSNILYKSQKTGHSLKSVLLQSKPLQPMGTVGKELEKKPKGIYMYKATDNPQLSSLTTY